MSECVCGFEAANSSGLAAHQRHCDQYPSEDPSESFEPPSTVSTAVADAVFERDDEHCVRCEGTDGLTLHRYDEGKEYVPQNLVTLCADCDEFLGDGTPSTKRNQVDR